jgi:hypothetical protein
VSQKYPTQKRVGRVGQVVECLPSKCEALSSNSRITSPKKKTIVKREEGGERKRRERGRKKMREKAEDD